MTSRTPWCMRRWKLHHLFNALSIIHFNSENQQSRMKDKVHIQLMISCLLRIKLIGSTALVWEIWHALKDTIFAAKNIEDEAGYSPTKLLDEIDVVTHNVWSQGMSAGWPEDYDKDPGYGPDVCDARKRKGIPVGKIHCVSSIWGPRFCFHTGWNDGDGLLSLAVQGDLILYLEDKIKQQGLGNLNRKGRPSLAYAVSPRGDRSSFENTPLPAESHLAKFSSPSVIKMLIRHRADPKEMYNGQKAWHTALQNRLFRWFSEDDDDEARKEDFCQKSNHWATTTTLLVENGADVVRSMPQTFKTPLEYLFPFWFRFAPRSEPIKELVSAIIGKMVSARRYARQLQEITPEMPLRMQEQKLRKYLGLRSSNDAASTDDRHCSNEIPSMNRDSAKVRQRIASAMARLNPRSWSRRHWRVPA